MDLQRELKDIFFVVNNKKCYDYSLLSGYAGVQLFNYLYIKHFGNYYNLNLNENLNFLSENSFKISYPSFCRGFSGTSWFYRYLENEGILKHADVGILCFRDQYLENISLFMLKNGNYDLLHGALGIGHYFLYSNPNKHYDYFCKVIAQLKFLSFKNSEFSLPNFDFQTNNIKENEINLSISHGITGVLKFCMECYKLGICVNESKFICGEIINFLIDNKNDAKNFGSYFPNVINKSKKKYQISRLAWCYGDLSIGFILYQASVLFKNSDLLYFSIEILLHSTNRKEIQQTMISDPWFCHGAAGVSYIFNKMWHYTKIQNFKIAGNYWLQKAMNFNLSNIKEDKLIGNGILEGVAGTGLLLLSRITRDFSWDYCLLLNDI